MIDITNRVLEKATKFSHTQIKRWAVAFLSPDKSTGQHSGVPRTYSIVEAIKIYLGGYLVEDLRFTISEAQTIVKDVTEWFKINRWRVSDWIELRKSKMDRGFVAYSDFPWEGLIISVGMGSKENIFYEAKIVLKKQLIKEPSLWREEYRLEHFGKLSAISTVPFRSIDIGSLITSLGNQIAQELSG